MPRTYQGEGGEGIQYYGNSDLLAQIAAEIEGNPSSCFSINALAWYNALYSDDPNDLTCAYQTEASEALCAELYGEPGDDAELSIGEAIDFLLDTATALGRRDGRRLIINACRLLRRGLIENTSRNNP